jgi:hypothetical protein
MHAQDGYSFSGGALIAGTAGDQDWSAQLYGLTVAAKVGGALSCLLAPGNPKDAARAIMGALHDGGVSGFRCFAKSDGSVWVADSKGATTQLVTALTFQLPNKFVSPRTQGALNPDFPDPKNEP